jgi:hypothetical protein
MIQRNEMATLPPAFAASALYDNLLQAALRQFFSRATFETEAIPSLSSDGRLAIEPTGDPSVLSVRWFGTRHVLHVPPRRPFTEHEVRLARAIGTVLSIRYRALFDPKQMLDRQTLFRGAIEDRYVGAFLDATSYADPTQTRADLIANAIEVLRVAALSSYENRAISSGVLILDKDMDPQRGRRPHPERSVRYSQELSTVKSFYRLCDGLHTAFLLNREGIAAGFGRSARRTVSGRVPVACARDRAHAGRLRRPQPDARDQGLRGRGSDFQLQERALAPAGHRSKIQNVGGVGREPSPRRAPLPDGSRFGRCP